MEGWDTYVPTGLNAPYGARCFLMQMDLLSGQQAVWVLMHFMLLGAF